MQRALWLPQFTMLLYWMTSQGVRPFIPLQIESRGGSPVLLSVAVVAYPACALALTAIVARAVDGPRPTTWMILGAGAGAGCGIAYGMNRSAPVLALFYALSAVPEMLAWIGLQAHLGRNSRAPYGRLMVRIASIAWGLGMAVGPLIGGLLLEHRGFHLLGIYYAAGYVALGGLWFWISRSPGVARTSRLHGSRKPAKLRFSAAVAQLWSIPIFRVMSISAFASHFVNSNRTSYYPIILQGEGLDVAAIGLLLSVAGASELAIRLVLPLVQALMHNLYLLYSSIALVVLGLAMSGFTANIGMLFIGAAMMGAGLGIGAQVGLEVAAVTGERIAPGSSAAIRVGMNRSAQLVQPIAFPPVLRLAGGPLSLPIAAALLGTGALAAVLPVFRRARGDAAREASSGHYEN